MKRLMALVIVVVSLAVLLYFLPRGSTEGLRIGLVVPVQNVALDDIVDGFKKEMAAQFAGRAISIDVQNALGDINLQKSAFNKFINDKVDIIVPIGKSATLMALTMAPKEQPVLFLAAFITPDSELVRNKPSLMGVIDEIPVTMQLDFMRAAMTDLKKLAVVYVSSDKVFDDVKEFSKEALRYGIAVQELMVQNLAELYTVASRIEPDNQAIFTLKDVMVASGINALVQQADALRIPLVTSDEGTIRSGGAFAVGVTEAAIGRQGAQIASSFLENNQFERIQYLRQISVFVNKSACAKQGVNADAIKSAAAQLKLSVVES